MTVDPVILEAAERASSRAARLLQAVEQVVNAWEEPGDWPDFHAWHKDRLLDEWRTLGVALENLSREFSQ